jgi:hypothetical protein
MIYLLYPINAGILVDLGAFGLKKVLGGGSDFP